ncbi:MAG: tetratricopeptide repeat protein, partial [Armatimonadota bacterium]
HQQQGALEKARQYYESALALQPQNLSLYSPLGDVYMRLGDDDTAMEAWKKASAYAGDDPQAIARFGRLLYERGRYGLALRMYSEAREQLEDDAAFGEQMARVYEALLDFERAIGEYLRTAAAASSEADPIPPATSLATELAESEGRLPFLIERAEALLQEHPGNAALVAVLVRAYARSGDSSKAAELLAAEGESARAPASFLVLLAEALLQQGSADAAADLFARAGRSAPDAIVQSEAALGLARSHAEQGDWQAAAAALEDVVATDSPMASDARVLFELAGIHLRHLRQIDRARALYEAIVAHDTGTRRRVEMGLADCLFARGEYEAAAQRYGEIAAQQSQGRPLLPPAPPFGGGPLAPVMQWGPAVAPVTMRPRYMVAECAFRGADLGRAGDLFQQLADEASGSAETNDALRRLQLIRGDMAIDPDGAQRYIAALNSRDRGAQEQARRGLDELVSARPRGPLADDALMLLASTLNEGGDFVAARDAYERLIASQPDSPLRAEAMLAVGRLCREHLDDESAAAAHYKRVPREYPHSPLAAQARLLLDDRGPPP